MKPREDPQVKSGTSDLAVPAEALVDAAVTRVRVTVTGTPRPVHTRTQLFLCHFLAYLPGSGERVVRTPHLISHGPLSVRLVRLESWVLMSRSLSPPHLRELAGAFLCRAWRLGRTTTLFFPLESTPEGGYRKLGLFGRHYTCEKVTWGSATCMEW